MDMCRFCLKTTLAMQTTTEKNIKLQIIDENIKSKYNFCIGISLTEDGDQLPQKICSTCNYTLLRSFRFKKQCLESQNVLNNFMEQLTTFKPSPEETTQFIKNPVATEFTVKIQDDINMLFSNSTRGEETISPVNEVDHEDSRNTNLFNSNEIIVLEQNEKDEQLPNILIDCDIETRDIDNSDLNQNIETDAESNYSLESLDIDSIPEYNNTSHSTGRTFFVVCYICGELKKRDGLPRHIRSHKIRDGLIPASNVKYKYKKDPAKYKTLCTVCGKTVANLRDHSNIHKEMTYDERPYGCNQCDKRFKYRSTLFGHKRTHSDEKRFKCPHCDEMFRGYHTKMQHITQTHTGEFRYECHLCERKFWLMARFKDHLKRAHKIESNHERKPMEKREGPAPIYECDECGKKFKSQRFMNEHIKAHILEEEEIEYNGYICPECDFQCTQNRELRIHIEKEHPNYELPPSHISLKWKNLVNHSRKIFER